MDENGEAAAPRALPSGEVAAIAAAPNTPEPAALVKTVSGQQFRQIFSVARATGSALGTALFGILVFALLKGIDYSTPHSLTGAAPGAVVAAIHTTLVAATCIAALGAWPASRTEQTIL